MSDVNINIHTTDFKAEAGEAGGSIWVDLTFKTKRGETEIVCFLEDYATAKALAAAINGARKSPARKTVITDAARFPTAQE